MYFTGHRTVGYVQIMRWWSSNLRQRPLQNLGSVAYCYIFSIDLPFPLFLPSDALTGGAAPSCPETPSTNVRIFSAQNHPPTWASPVSFPAYQFSRPLPYPSLSVLSPSNPPFLSPHLGYSCRRCTLAASKIFSTVTFSCFSASACLHYGKRSFPLPS